MSKALIIFGSTTGNTESVAEIIANTLTQKGIDIEIKNVADAHLDDLNKDYDFIILGTSTWGDDEIEFQEDFEPFYDQMSGLKMKGKKIALFGCGDSSYEFFCGAIDLLEERIEDMGAEELVESLRIDGDVDSSEVEDWATSLYQEFSS